jgi:hypothetical protein
MITTEVPGNYVRVLSPLPGKKSGTTTHTQLEVLAYFPRPLPRTDGSKLREEVRAITPEGLPAHWIAWDKPETPPFPTCGSSTVGEATKYHTPSSAPTNKTPFRCQVGSTHSRITMPEVLRGRWKMMLGVA